MRWLVLAVLLATPAAAGHFSGAGASGEVLGDGMFHSKVEAYTAADYNADLTAIVDGINAINGRLR